MDIDLKDVLNEEELLHLCLEVVCKCNSDETFTSSNHCNYAMRFVVAYAMKECGPEDEEEISEKTNELIANHIINNMIKNGLIEENLEGDLKLTELGYQAKEDYNE